MGIGVEICIVFIEFFYVQVSLHSSAYPQKREDAVSLKQRQLWVGFLSVSVVWEVWSGWFDKGEGQSISGGSTAKAPSSPQGGSRGKSG